MKPLSEIVPEIENRLGNLPPVSESELKKWEWENIVRPNLLATRLPEPYFSKVACIAEQQSVYEKAKSLLQNTGAIVALVGPRGVGKTTIAAQLIRDRASDQSLEPWKRRPPYRKASEIVSQFKSLFADYGSIRIEQLTARFRDYSEFPFLVIDEWHECEELKMRDRVMTDLLDRRYSRNNDTLLISNQTSEDFIASTNESTISRLSESGAILRCEWTTFR